MFVGLVVFPVPHGVDEYDLVVTHTPDLPATIQFNEYFHETRINGNFPLTTWNHFRSDIPRTNNHCEGYTSRLAKQAVISHLDIYELILLFKSENDNKEAQLLQLEGGQKQSKSRRTGIQTQALPAGNGVRHVYPGHGFLLVSLRWRSFGNTLCVNCDCEFG